jgi:hypothetical protein
MAKPSTRKNSCAPVCGSAPAEPYCFDAFSTADKSTQSA